MDSQLEALIQMMTNQGQSGNPTVDPRLTAMQKMSPPKIFRGGSSENYNPTAPRELPPEYMPEERSYKGPDIPLDQFPTGPKDPYEEENMFSDLPPSVKRRHDTFKMRNKGEGPATDSDYDEAFGPGATERSMGGNPIQPRINETQTTEEELEDVHSQMDKEAGVAGEDRALGTPPLFSGDLTEDLTVFDDLNPKDLTANDIELFIHLHGKDALPEGYFD